MRLDLAVADTSALLAMVGVLPIEPPDVSFVYAPDVALVETIAVLRSFHDGRLVDVNGDLALIGPMVAEWVGAHTIAGTLAELAVDQPDEIIADLASVATAKATGLPLVTGLPHLADLDRRITVVVLAHRRPSSDEPDR